MIAVEFGNTRYLFRLLPDNWRETFRKRGKPPHGKQCGGFRQGTGPASEGFLPRLKLDL